MKIITKQVSSIVIFTLVSVLKCNGEPPPSSYSAPQKDRPSPAYGPPPNGGHGAPNGPNSRPGGGPPGSNYGPPPSPDIRPPSNGGGGGGFGKPSHSGQPSNGGGYPDSGSDAGAEDAKPEPFSFMYEVKDAATGNDFSHRQESDGKSVKGEYKVLLPDGRNQVVTYTADDGGYNAEVKYDGEAQPNSAGGSPNAGGKGGSGAAGGYPSGGPPGYPADGPGGFASGGSSGYPSGGPKNKPGLELPSKSPSGGGSPSSPGGSSFGGYPSGSPAASPQSSYLPPNFSGY